MDSVTERVKAGNMFSYTPVCTPEIECDAVVVSNENGLCMLYLQYPHYVFVEVGWDTITHVRGISNYFGVEFVGEWMDMYVEAFCRASPRVRDEVKKALRVCRCAGEPVDSNRG
jgi:hypothetical protein